MGNKMVTVNNGSNSMELGLAGKTVRQARRIIQDDVGWRVGELDFSLNGDRSRDLPWDDSEDALLEGGQTLTFLPRAGNKGLNFEV